MQAAACSFHNGVRFVKLSKSQVETFWSRVNILSDSECWEWGGYIEPKTGYGVFNPSERPFGAHRLSFGICKGDIPIGLVVMHSCDNRKCVNPNHLSIGTHGDNVRDMVSKERQAKGETSGHRLHPERMDVLTWNLPQFRRKGEKCNLSKLTAEKVKTIRAKYESGGFTLQDLATENGVTVPTIWAITTRFSWKHI